MAITIAVAIEINATVADVWQVVEPIERHVDWMTDAEAITFTTEQTRGVGTRFVCDTKVGPIRLADHMEITRWEPGSRIGVRHTGIVDGTGSFLLEAIDLGRRTRFSWVETLSFPWYLGGRIGERLGGTTVLRQIWRNNLHSLRDLVEHPPRIDAPGRRGQPVRRGRLDENKKSSRSLYICRNLCT